jgi:hypothetical protein
LNLVGFFLAGGAVGATALGFAREAESAGDALDALVEIVVDEIMVEGDEAGAPAVLARLNAGAVLGAAFTRTVDVAATIAKITTPAAMIGNRCFGANERSNL